MKYSIKFMFLFLLMVISSSLFSQTVLGLRGGINLATYDENPFSGMDSNLDMKTMIGADMAFFVKFPVLHVLAIQPELHFTQKGVRATMTTTDNLDVEMTLRYNYLELPVLAQFDIGSESLAFNFFFGPSVGYALDGRFIGKNANIFNGNLFQKGDFEEDMEWDTEYGIDGTKDNRFDISAVVGVGLSYDVGEGQILLDARYNHDVTDQTSYEETPSPEPDKYHNRNFTITAGFAIPLAY